MFQASKNARAKSQGIATHSLGISAGLAVITGILAALETPWSRALAIAQDYIWNKVQASSRKSYQTGWRLWQAWASGFGTSDDMTKLPADNSWQTSGLNITFREACVMAFLATLAHDHLLKPSTISAYLSGVRFMLLQGGDDTKFIETSAFIKSTKTGINIVYLYNIQLRVQMMVIHGLIFKMAHIMLCQLQIQE